MVAARGRGRALALSAVLALSVVVVPPGAAQAWAWPERAPERSVAGTAAGSVAPPALEVTAEAVTSAPEVTSPRAGAVEVLDRAAAERAGVNGVLFRARATGSAAVELDYSGFRQAFGGDFATRLRVVDLRSGRVVPARNDTAAGRIRAEVAGGTAGGRTTGPDGVRVAAAPGPLYALTAGTAGEAGSFAPTSLAPSATWAVGVQSGDFSWNYPIQAPPAPGPTPQIALAYSSGVVDGRTASTNNQSSWVGEGFGYEPGFIERTYKPCAEDGHPGKGDLCWDRQAAHLVLPGVTGELVWDATKGVWRVANDEGWRVESRTGAANGDNDGEHWVVTGPDGTQYSFGRNGNAKSTWTVPVFGNDADEPCHGPSFDTSWCQQGYRWTLDTVTDVHGDQVTYSYDTETNHYGRAGVASNATPYVRAGHLARIDYGHRADTEPTARVLFDSGSRCIPGSVCDASHPVDWPDTPWDLGCAGGNCPAAGPSFWGTKRLAKITTQVRQGAGFAEVDSWTLDHVFPGTEDHTSPTLWLRSITRTGHVGGTASLPGVLFDGVRLANRVGAADGLQPMNKWRLSRIYNETGGVTEVGYLNDRCDPATLPRQDANEENCFPTYWLRQGAATPELGWFNKYVVGEVAEVDRVGQAPRKVTRYEYVDAGPAWRYDAAELVPSRFKTWGSWRGFQKVKVRTGDADGPQTLTEHLFLRGMHDDLLIDGTRRKVEVVDSQNKKFEDKPGLAGFARETVVRDAATGAEISAEFQQPWLSDPTAVRNRDSGPLEARVLKVDSVQTRTVVAGGARLAETRTEHDGYGSVTKVHDLGDVAVADDDVCTTTTYVRNTTAWILNRPNRVVTASVPCGTTANPADIVSDERTFYDGATSVDAAPTKGDVTKTEELASWDGTQPVYATTSRATHDLHGRVVESFDASGAKTTTAYRPATGGPVTGVTVTNPLGHTTTTESEPARGRTTATVEANNRRGERTYDPLGRLTAAWQPGRPGTESPTVRHEYLIRADGPAVVTTHRLLGSGDYATSHTLYDGLLRERQTQSPSPNGGRIVTDTLYDTHGRVSRTNAGYHNPDAPSTSLLVVADADVPSQDVVEYDGAGRTSAEVLRSYGQEKHRTTFTHGGDRVSEDPPAGGTPTTEITDVRGRLVELRQYSGDGPTGDFHATTYGYTKAGKRSSVTDPAGNAWRFDYDLRGRQVRVEDPDKGVATMAYDDKGRLTGVTDARGRTLTHTYDPLDRRTALHEGATRLAEWTFDSLPGGVGAPVAAIRHVDGEEYRTETLGYTAQGLPTGTAVTIPSREGALAGRYESTVDYNQAGQVVTTTVPAVGGLPAETLTTGHNAVGLEQTLGSDLAQYVVDTGYTNTGRLRDRILGGRVMRSYTYDDATSRLTGVKTELDTGAVAVDLNLGYDAIGNVVSSADTVSGDAQCFRTDSFRRLVEAWTAADCAAPSLEALGGPEPYWHTYGYDRAGNRTRETRHAAGGDTVRDYAYPAGSHRVATVTSGSQVDGYGYDAAGNTTTRPGQTLSWNAEGRLAEVRAGADATTFEYDADGNRLLRRDPAGSTLYLGSAEVRLQGGVVTGTRHYAVGGTTVAVRTESGLSWLADDHAGTAGAAVDADSLDVTVRRQLPYGAPRGTVPVWPGEQGFVGGATDPTGLTHLGARDYDPAVGAFVSADPILNAEDPQQLQGYAYASNSPVSFADPSGLTSKLSPAPEPARTILWDAAVTAYRTGGDLGYRSLYTWHAPAAESERPAYDSPASFIDQLVSGRGGWSPKVPPGYTTPPGAESPTPVPGIPSGGSGGSGYGSPGDGSRRVDCRSEGSVRTCHYSPIRKPSYSYSGGRVIGYDLIGEFGDGYGDTHGGPYVDDGIGEFDYGDGYFEEREYWEYDRCKPWNPCDTKPGFVKGYNPPGLYDDDKKKGKGGSKNTGKGGSKSGKKKK
ncbi:RHS repeat-associated core domain-containing protein [Actinosynnema sp. CS-041913]|uniref:RHS repeat-associated core domain-containing protein n=1 Tax=Actinosynnema sp. CS-041913 TaxID=3239917 RepID=UPI003D8FCCD3